jgi:hypothetical protein
MKKKTGLKGDATSYIEGYTEDEDNTYTITTEDGSKPHSPKRGKTIRCVSSILAPGPEVDH